MLNHIWTLLVNESTTASVRGRLGELPQTAGYNKVVLPAGLNSVRRALYGANPDIEMLHYRTNQFIKCVLSSNLQAYAYTFDARNTYNETISDFFGTAAYRPTPQQISGSSALTMNIHGTPTAPDASGIIRHSYSLTTIGGDVHLTGLNGTTDLITGLTANEQKALGKSGYTFSLSDPAQPQTWLIEFLNKPTAALGTLIANVEVCGETSINELFGITTTEPYSTFRNIFFDSPDLPLRCAAVVLALAYQTESRRVTA